MQALVEQNVGAPLLDQRFATIKKSLVRSEHKARVIESYDKLIKALRSEIELIERQGAASVPEIDFQDVLENGGELPPALVDIVHERGCIILRNVVPEAEAVAWEASLKDYVQRHPRVSGVPRNNPVGWNVYWSKAQMQMRSHPCVMQAMRAVSRLWHVSDPATPIDLDSQVIYPDRFRIRHPSTDPDQFPLKPHLDSGSIERWEDPANRQNFAAIFEGEWPRWDAWAADFRVHAKSDLYAEENRVSCSAWRSLQGWLSLSHAGTGEGTLRLLPSLKLSMAYIMLRPLFHTGAYDDSLPTFPGAIPGHTQFFPTREHHADLDLERTLVGIPPVRPGDYVFWHCDLVHGVDPTHHGTTDSSVFYNACVPLTPSNIESLLATRDAFRRVDAPVDFARSTQDCEKEWQHEDNGAKEENILSSDGKRALGLLSFDEDDPSLTEGQKHVRKLANEKLGLDVCIGSGTY